MTAPLIPGFPISGKSKETVLSHIGVALLQVKSERGIRLSDMSEALRKSDDQVSLYIAGEAEMSAVTLLRACEEYPELVTLIAETAADRAAKARQRPLDISLPVKRDKAA